MAAAVVEQAAAALLRVRMGPGEEKIHQQERERRDVEEEVRGGLGFGFDDKKAPERSSERSGGTGGREGGSGVRIRSDPRRLPLIRG